MAAKLTKAEAVEDIIGNLCAQIERAEDLAMKRGIERNAERKRAADAEARITALVDALRPFAKIAEPISDWWSDERRANSLNIEHLKIADLRRAKALVDVADALSQHQGGTDGQ